MRLEGKTALITGGASGIGAAAAELFAQEGARVAIVDIQPEAGEALADRLGDGYFYRDCNVTQEDDVAAAVEAAVAQFGRLDAVFHCAGIVGSVGPCRHNAR